MVLQITENEHQNHKKTVSGSPRKFNEGYFYLRSFQIYSRTSMENSRPFQGYPTIFQFQGLFNDMMVFQGLFKACANHAHCITCLI